MQFSGNCVELEKTLLNEVTRGPKENSALHSRSHGNLTLKAFCVVYLVWSSSESQEQESDFWGAMAMEGKY